MHISITVLQTCTGLLLLKSENFTVHKTKLGKGNVFTPVCHSVHGGRCTSTPGQTPHLGRHIPPGQSPPGQSPPRQTPPHPLGRHPGGRHPLDRHPLGRHPRQTPPKSATTADGMHPTGMHSCLFYCWPFYNGHILNFFQALYKEHFKKEKKNLVM